MEVEIRDQVTWIFKALGFGWHIARRADNINGWSFPLTGTGTGLGLE